MSEFSASVLLEAEVDQSSLRAARAQIEDDIGSVPVSATDQLTSSTQSGAGATASLLEDNVDLNQERNDILHDILDATEMTARNAGGGGLRTLLRTGTRGAMLLGGGGAALVSVLASVNWTSVMSEAMPDIKPGDVIDKTKVTADDLIDDAADISKGDVVEETVQATDVVGDALPISAAALAANSLPVQIGAFVADKLPVGVANLVAEDLPAEAADLVTEDLPVTAADVVKDDLPIGVETILASTPVLSLGAILAKGEFPIKPGDIFGSGDPSGDGSPSGDGGGGGGLPIAELVGGGATAAGLFKILQNQGKIPGLSGSSGVSALLPAEMFQAGPTDQWIQEQFGDDIPGSILTEEGRQERTQIASELATMLFGGDTGPEANGNTRRPDSSVSTGGVNVNESFIGMARNQTGGNAPGPQVEVVTVGGESNRNETSSGRDGQFEFTGSIDHNVTVTQDFERDIKKQLRRNGVPRALIDAILDELDREVR